MSNITWSNKTTGSQVTASDMNEIKTAVNSKAECAFMQTATKTVLASNGSIETSLLGTGVGSLAFANLQAGKQLRIKLSGVYSTGAANNNQLTIRVRLGGVLLATAVADASVINAVNFPFDANIFVTCRSAGASGKFMTTGIAGFADRGTGGSSAFGHLPINNGITETTVDTTASVSLDVTVQYENTNAGFEISCLNASVELI